MAGLKKSTENNSELTKVVDQIESESIRTFNDEIEVSEDGYVHRLCSYSLRQVQQEG